VQSGRWTIVTSRSVTAGVWDSEPTLSQNPESWAKSPVILRPPRRQPLMVSITIACPPAIEMKKYWTNSIGSAQPPKTSNHTVRSGLSIRAR
jgi:hypothetical protein